MTFLEKHPKTAAILIILGVALFTVAVAYAAATYFSSHASTATIDANMALTETLDGSAFAKDAPLDWGKVLAGGIYTKTLAVSNTGNVDAVVTVASPNLPAGWSLAWEKSGQSVAKGATLTGTLTLTVSASATPQAYSFNMNVNGA